MLLSYQFGMTATLVMRPWPNDPARSRWRDASGFHILVGAYGRTPLLFVVCHRERQRRVEIFVAHSKRKSWKTQSEQEAARSNESN